MKELNIVNYTRKTPFNQFCLAHAIFKSFIDAYTDDNGFIYFKVETDSYEFYSNSTDKTITARLRPNVPDNDYIVYEGKLYNGNELYDLYAKVQNEITERAIDGLS